MSVFGDELLPTETCVELGTSELGTEAGVPDGVRDTSDENGGAE